MKKRLYCNVFVDNRYRESSTWPRFPGQFHRAGYDAWLLHEPEGRHSGDPFIHHPYLTTGRFRVPAGLTVSTDRTAYEQIEGAVILDVREGGGEYVII